MNNYPVFYNEMQPYAYHMQDPDPWCSYQNNSGYMPPTQNRFVYLKQNFIQTPQDVLGTTVHINPNFKKKVFVNPNFQGNVIQKAATPKIHINPNITSNTTTQINKIHVNPNILQKIPVPDDNTKVKQENVSNKIVYSSRTKLIRKPERSLNVSVDNKKTRRVSVCSKYKIVKSSLQKKKQPSEVKSKYRKILRYKLVNVKNVKINKKNSRYKLDNRLKKEILSPKKICIVKYKTPSASLLKIGDVLYQKSLHSLRRTSGRVNNSSNLKIQAKVISKSRYKLRRKSIIKNIPTKNSVLKKSNSKTRLRLVKVTKVFVSPGKLKKCNIPCPYFRKFGKCVRFEKGRCPRKHDSDQIALCTKFLQGACINEKCLLSHNVSPEKMPTCKYYLEGTCSKDQCPYLHVRISPKADVCRDFLEGFCKKATECDKRHQFLCPDFEKYGKCLKQRCSYPHGRMVRKYSVFSNNKFAKKSSEVPKNRISKHEIDGKVLIGKEDRTESENDKVNVKTRYYTERKMSECGESSAESAIDKVCDPELPCVRSRPNLGTLPSYIALEDS